ncbi:MAG: ATP-binding protein, partial [Gemmatimonadaceae bacterium]
SIAHLNDEERMFFVTMLLADILAWIRTQPGTSSLRAILYIDELFGYMPPVANPSSKILLLTLLKQARAFGLGIVLSTQNPVDLDYKGLSNAGTWFIGRLQTERDKARLMEGLEGAASGGSFDKDAMEKTIAGLGKRVFLMHSVHEAVPITFETRWTMSYLAGPMTREQIKAVTKASGAPSVVASTSATTARAAASNANPSAGAATNTRAPVLPPEVPQYFIPPASSTTNVSYKPAILAVADVTYASAKYSITEQRRVTILTTLDDGPIAMDWGTGERVDIDPNALEKEPRAGATFDEVPKLAASAKSYPVWSKSLQKWITANEVVTLYRSPSTKTLSNVGENERDFRIRLQVDTRESRDKGSDALRSKYAPKVAAIQERIRRAEQSVAREQQESSQAKMASVVSFGSAILGAFLGRGKIGVGTINKVSTAARSAGRVMKQGGDVTRAGETVEALQQQNADLEAQLQAEIAALAASFDSTTEQFEEITVKAKAGDVSIPLIALAWRP